MKILLLGAAGFIGTNLTIELAKKTEDEITLVDRSKAFFKPIVSMDLKNVHILEADLTVDMDFDSILKDQEVVYHLVSTTVPTTSNQHISQELVSNVIFSANLFEACIRCGVKKVVFVSSGGTVYGKEVDCPLKEKTATNPISSYGVQKITIEKLLYLYKDLRQLEKSVGENDEDNSNLDLFSLEMFEDLAWLMARHADPAKVPDSPEEFLDQFNTFSIYQILPQLIELWGLNVQTEVESRKNLEKVSGK